MINKNSHLGGHLNITHIDAGTVSFLRERFDIKTVLDVGCGPGGMQTVCERMGLSWTGVDGDPSCVRDEVIEHDFTKGKISTHKRDLVWSVEFVEHVEEGHIDNILDALSLATKAVCMTHALPGKKGFHHVNCQNEDYWIEKMDSVGFKLDEQSTQHVRKISTMRREFMRSTGKIFITK